MQRLNQFLEKKKPGFKLKVQEGTNNSVEMYNGTNLIAYYA